MIDPISSYCGYSSDKLICRMVPLLSCAGIILITASLVRRIFFYRLSEFDHLSKAEEAGINASLLLESAQKSLALEQRYHYVSQEASHKVLLDIRKLHSGFERKIKQITSLCENALNHLEKARKIVLSGPSREIRFKHVSSRIGQLSGFLQDVNRHATLLSTQERRFFKQRETSLSILKTERAMV
jgi:hypothetical protein